MAAPPLISSHWFPPDQRTTATSINQENMKISFETSDWSFATATNLIIIIS